MRYSDATQISRDNVTQLKQAWIFHTEDISNGKDGRERSGLETTPIMVDGTLYLTTAFNRVIALDPETGKQKWAYDPHIDQKWESGDGLINRGLSTWLDRQRMAKTPCSRRIFEATIDARLIALDAWKGTPCEDFGHGGEISLRDVPGFRTGWYHITSPPAVIDDIVIVGSAIDDNGRADMPSGVVRAFDARNGALRWSWDPDGCCEIRKVKPLAKALADFDASLTGRKAFQANTRSQLPRFELDHSDAQGRIKINPLIDWTAEDIEAYLAEHNLPRHPLVAEGYPSIGCSPCTHKVAPGEDARSGRWKGWDKTECGIHSPNNPDAYRVPPEGFDPGV